MDDGIQLGRGVDGSHYALVVGVPPGRAGKGRKVEKKLRRGENRAWGVYSGHEAASPLRVADYEIRVGWGPEMGGWEAPDVGGAVVVKCDGREVEFGWIIDGGATEAEFDVPIGVTAMGGERGWMCHWGWGVCEVDGEGCGCVC